MVRAPCCDKIGLVKGAWTKQEDQILKAYVEKHGPENWRSLPRKAGLLRCGKSCRFRWTNYLRPDIKLGNYSREEEETIINLHAKFGNRWSQIAAKLPGRTDNEIKNVWHTHLKKRQKQGSAPQEGSRIRLEPPALKPDTSNQIITNCASTLELSEEVYFSPSTESYSLTDHSPSHMSDIGSRISSTSLHTGEEPGLNRGPYDNHECHNSNEEDISSFWIKILMELDELPNC